ncbi:DNA polymerase III subunit gamma/tau [Candidatus Acetothermia bacterium]|nr:MAG: DNA polymerase III subunit gamma/tau [Candidatus Acetothermia bacterium]
MTEKPAHLALYRRWRPQRFSEVVGQEEIVQTLRNAVASDEAAHAYLFAGERGIGKTSVARILARAVNCPNRVEGEPCNECPTCKAILANRSLDIIEIDGASNRGIDHIRRLREEVNFAPTDLRRKVYIIDEVHMLTNEAFNALLKTLEEPPSHAIFIFATTEPHKVPRTIVSRCQAFEFRRIPAGRIAGHLRRVAEAEGMELTAGALETIARRANGGMRDALVMLEQAISHGGRPITADAVLDMLGLVDRETHAAFIEAIERNDQRRVIETIDSLVERGKDLEIFLADVIEAIRDRLLNGEGPAEREIAIARGLLDVKADLFRALDRRIRLEIGVLDLMARLNPDRTSSGNTGAEEPVAAERTVEDTPPSGPPIPEGIAPIWNGMLAEIEKERIAIAAFLLEGRPNLEDGRLIIRFPRRCSFHKESLEKTSNLQYLAGSVRRHFGDDVRVEVGYEGEKGGGSGGDSLFEAAQLVCRMFDGEIIKEEK